MKIPTLNGRVEKAVRLALAGDVDAHADGTATVYSASDPTRRYEIIEGTCTCRDWEQAPEHLCQHRLAAGFVRKAVSMLPPSPAIETGPHADNVRAPLPEAPASANCHILLEGRQVQITLRDTDEGRLLQRLTTVLQQYPVATAPTAPAEGWCTKHGVQMALNQKQGRSWWSHKTAEGWCKGK